MDGFKSVTAHPDFECSMSTDHYLPNNYSVYFCTACGACTFEAREVGEVGVKQRT